MIARTRRPQYYEPTPDEIRAACLRFQAGWSEEEAANRAAWATPGWSRAPMVRPFACDAGDADEDGR